MRNQSLSDSDRQKSILRWLKTLVVVLVLSNIALGGFGFYYLRTIDRKYSDLIEQAVPTLDRLQELTARSMEAMRNTNPASFGGSAESQAEAMQRARTNLGREAALRDLIGKSEWHSAGVNEPAAFQNAGETFNKTAMEVVSLFGAGRTAEAVKLREQSLRPAFERYVSATTEAADLLQSQSLKASNTVREKTHSVSRMMLGLAGWPVIVISLFLLTTAIMVALVLLLFDRQPA